MNDLHPTSNQKSHPRLRIAVIGPSTTDSQTLSAAETIGRGLATGGAIVVCGGRGGIMEAAARGCRSAGGTTLGILPGADATETPPNEAIDIPVFTGIGQARNLAVVLTAEVAVAVGGGWGTLSEIALARKHGRPVVLFGAWRLDLPDIETPDGLHPVETPEEAVATALRLARTGTKP